MTKVLCCFNLKMWRQFFKKTQKHIFLVILNSVKTNRKLNKTKNTKSNLIQKQNNLRNDKNTGRQQDIQMTITFQTDLKFFYDPYEVKNHVNYS